MTVMGQNAKYSSRVDVFRFASKLGRSSMRSALRICANNGHSGMPIIRYASANFSKSSLRNSVWLLRLEMRWVESSCNATSHARLASSKWPDLA
jgi:hypothetical protein